MELLDGRITLVHLFNVHKFAEVANAAQTT
jgi:hypothetical protein